MIREREKIVTTGDNGVASVSLQGRLPGTGKVRVTHGESGLTWVASVAVVTDEAKLAAPGLSPPRWTARP